MTPAAQQDAIAYPPASEVAWRAHRREPDADGRSGFVLVTARLWFEARQKAARMLGCDPELVEVVRA